MKACRSLNYDFEYKIAILTAKFESTLEKEAHEPWQCDRSTRTVSQYNLPY